MDAEITSLLLEAGRAKLRDGGSFSEKRKETRYPAADPVEVRTLPDGVPLRATIIDISRSGLRLELDEAIAKFGTVEILTQGKLAIFGEIRYCQKTAPSVFQAGVLIQGVVSPEREATDHLPEEHIVLYVAGKGLTPSEVDRVEEHLSNCRSCSRFRLQTAKSMYPVSQRMAPRRDPIL